MSSQTKLFLRQETSHSSSWISTSQVRFQFRVRAHISKICLSLSTIPGVNWGMALFHSLINFPTVVITLFPETRLHAGLACLLRSKQRRLSVGAYVPGPQTRAIFSATPNAIMESFLRVRKPVRRFGTPPLSFRRLRAGG